MTDADPPTNAGRFSPLKQDTARASDGDVTGQSGAAASNLVCILQNAKGPSDRRYAIAGAKLEHAPERTARPVSRIAFFGAEELVPGIAGPVATEDTAFMGALDLLPRIADPVAAEKAAFLGAEDLVPRIADPIAAETAFLGAEDLVSRIAGPVVAAFQGAEDLILRITDPVAAAAVHGALDLLPRIADPVTADRRRWRAGVYVTQYTDRVGKPSYTIAIVKRQLLTLAILEAAGGCWLRAGVCVTQYADGVGKPSYTHAIVKRQLLTSAILEAAGTKQRLTGVGAIRSWALRLAPELDTELRRELVTKTRKAAGLDHRTRRGRTFAS